MSKDKADAVIRMDVSENEEAVVTLRRDKSNQG